MVSTRRTAHTCLWLALGAAAPAQQDPDEALRVLREGNRRFAADRSVPQPAGEGVRRTLARGQSPLAVVLTCGDSRVAPEHVFNAGLGDLCVVRVAGHVASPEVIASVEQAVTGLGVPLCVVLGHEGCDVVAATISEFGDAGSGRESRRTRAVLQLLERIEPAVRKARDLDLGGAALQAACEEEHAHRTAHELLRRSEVLRRHASVGRLRVVAARYRFDGSVDWLPPRPLPPAREAELTEPTGAVPTEIGRASCRERV